MKKKIFSFFTTLVMLCSFVGVMPENLNPVKPLTAEAAASDFTAEQAVAWANNCAETKWNTDVDGVFGVQCVDLILGYYSYLGVNRVSGNATDYQSNALQSGWTRVTSSPKPGDIIVWAGNTNINPNYTLDSNGHIGIVVAVSGNDLTTVETNADGIVTHAQKKSRNASYAACFIRPDFITPPPPIPTGHEMSESEAAGQTIPDGEYHILSELNQNYGLACGGRTNTEKGTNVFLNNWGDSAYGTHMENIGRTDTWKVTYLNNGFYRIQQNGVNVSLDISGGDLHRGTNVQVWENHNGTPEQWSIRKTNHGYTIQARCNAYYLDVSGGVVENGRNIQVWEGNDSKAQSWCFVPYNPDRVVEDGTYRIHSELDEEFVIDACGNLGEYVNGSNIQIFDSSGDDFFVLEYADNGYYRIKEPVSGLYVEVWNDNGGADYAKCATNIQLFVKTESRGQFWSIQNMHGNTYTLISMLNGYALDLEDGKCVNGQNISMHPLNTITSSPAQRWTLEPVTLKSIKVAQKPDKTTYFIDEKLNPAGIIVNAVYSGDYSFKIAKGLTYEYDFSTPSEKTVNVKYEISGKSLTDTFKVTVNEIDFKGSGTKTDPYLIENKSDLEKMRDLINSEDYAPAFRSCYYLQTADIQLNDEKWTPIGKAWANGEQNAMNFQGHYDGGQHWIYGLNVDEETKFAGLFGCISSAVVEQLAVEGNVSGSSASVGGIVGEIQNATVSDCCFIGNVTGKSDGVGGIAGYLWQRGIVQNCYHIGNVKTSDTHSAGGVVGRIQSNEVANAVCTVDRCYHVGKMDEAQKYNGTIVGAIDKIATDVGQKIHLKNCYGLSSDGALYAGDKPDTDSAQAVKESVLKLMAPTLGDAFVKNTESSYLEGYPIFQWQTRLQGDVNADGKFNIADVVFLQKYLVKSQNLTSEKFLSADINSDGKVNVFDVIKLKRIILNA